MKQGLLWIAALALSLVAVALEARAWLHGPHPSLWSSVEREHAKVAEAKVAVTEIAWGVAQCAERSGTLPATSPKVPRAIGPVKGMIYQSQLSEWSDPAFACSGFHMLRPQFFQYQWVRAEGADEGVVQADADFDGDGAVDHTVRLDVRCARVGATLRCRPDRMPTAPFAPKLSSVWWE